MTTPIDQQALGRWHALQAALEAVSPLANWASDGVVRAGPDERLYAEAKAATLGSLRDRLVASLRLAGAEVPADSPRATVSLKAARR